MVYEKEGPLFILNTIMSYIVILFKLCNKIGKYKNVKQT